ncbi:MAG: Holliday junction resolvase RuvX [bacterium]|nr:Holliday junction resolvase RuvX [bacterium]
MSNQRASVLAIDHGEKRTGFAVADALRIGVEPLGVHHGAGDGEELLDYVERLMHDRDVECIVVGYPFNMDGTSGPRTKAVDAFLARLAERLPGVPLVRRDERLSTKEAEDALREAGHHGKERKARRDSWSAMVILRDWIRAGEPRS